jgi:hypothetical protein
MWTKIMNDPGGATFMAVVAIFQALSFAACVWIAWRDFSAVFSLVFYLPMFLYGGITMGYAAGPIHSQRKNSDNTGPLHPAQKKKKAD